MPRANWKAIGTESVYVPDLATQRKIADFPDRETGRINCLGPLPPKLPELNGCIERTNGTWSCEFHGCRELEYEDLVKMNRCIDAFADEFNRVRPHRSLGGLTPEQTLKTAA